VLGKCSFQLWFQLITAPLLLSEKNGQEKGREKYNHHGSTNRDVWPGLSLLSNANLLFGYF
jgi:hypothetical protein